MVYCRDARDTAREILQATIGYVAFDSEFDFAPFVEETTEVRRSGRHKRKVQVRRYFTLMSACWAYERAGQLAEQVYARPYRSYCG